MIKSKFLLFITILGLLIYVSLTAWGVESNTHLESTSINDAINQANKKEEVSLHLLRKEILIKHLEAYFQDALDAHLIIGAGVSIVSGDSVLFNGGFGRRNSTLNERVNAQTVFRLGSLSKGFTGVLAGIEVHNGNLNWEDKLAEAIPQFHLKDKENEEAITLSTILSHTTGVPYHCYTNLVEAGLSMSQIAERFDIIKSTSKPGQLYSYQNAMFALSGEMLQIATGDNMHELLQNRIFNPLDMQFASTDYDALVGGTNYAYPHKNTAQGFKPIPVNKKYYNAIPAGGINASPEDMSKWMRFLLGYNESVLSKTNLQTIFTPQIEMIEARKYYQRWEGHLKSSYAYGWRIHEFKDSATEKKTTMIHHGGSVNNYRNEIALYPEEELGICILFNSMTPLATSVIPDVHKIVRKVMQQSLADFERNAECL
ncbi:serine hydrolase domain-containing protein [Leeuwenhoekiella aequorea]|uniref:serine hydrolase domain-containing protein n=1 Tax=Leeuwenhoekiella aequorea TaxID=283736 RepID=UPI0019D42CC6|nr:serine hydrolase domain-containing protein [Leeuwenhoekiella aequorea]